MTIYVAILEDNLSSYTTTKRQIELWGQERGHVMHISWFQSGTALLNANIVSSLHILFADIELNSGCADTASLNGLETCTQLRNRGFNGEIFILTAFREYVFDGYDVHALNYLLKPVSDEKMFLCLDKYVKLHNEDYYYFRKDQSITQIAYSDIISISKEGNNIIIQTKNHLYTQRGSLSDFEKRLPSNFIRCHKSCIINIFHVKVLSGNQLKLSNNTIQSVGRNYLQQLRSVLINIASN